MKRLTLWLFGSLVLVGVGRGYADPVAQVGPVAITEADMKSDVGLQISEYEALNGLYEKKRAWLDHKVRETLYGLAAKDAKMTTDAWKKKEIDAKVVAPTDAEIATLTQSYVQRYSQQQNQPGFDMAKMTAEAQKQAAMQLKAQKTNMREAQVFAELTQKYPITTALVAPVAPDIKIPISPTDPVKGPATARVTLVEFTDIQCPYCKRSQDTLKQVLATYPNDVKLVAKQFPLTFHNRAKPTAIAAMCAKDQGKFWEFREKAFANNTQLEDADLLRYAKESGVNEKKFNACLKSDGAVKRVDEEIALGSSLGVQGTPHFFVNGKIINGAQPFEAFKTVIDQELAKKS